MCACACVCVRACVRVCVRVCACVRAGHHYYGYSSDIRVDEVVYETIDPDKNSGEGLCGN